MRNIVEYDGYDEQVDFVAKYVSSFINELIYLISGLQWMIAWRTTTRVPRVHPGRPTAVSVHQRTFAPWRFCAHRRLCFSRYILILIFTKLCQVSKQNVTNAPLNACPAASLSSSTLNFGTTASILATLSVNTYPSGTYTCLVSSPSVNISASPVTIQSSTLLQCVFALGANTYGLGLSTSVLNQRIFACLTICGCLGNSLRACEQHCFRDHNDDAC